MKKIFPLILLIFLCIPAISFSEGYSNKPAVYTGIFEVKEKNPSKKAAELEPATGEAAKPAGARMQPVYSTGYNKDGAKPAVKPAVLPKKTVTGQAPKPAPVYTKPQGRVAKTIFSTTSDGQRVLITFNQRPQMKTSRSSDGTINFYFVAPVEYTPPKVPRAFQKNFLKVEGSKDSKGNLIITIQHDPAKTADVSFATSMILVDVKSPKKPEDKAKEEAEKAEAAKKKEEKAEAKKEAEAPKPVPPQYIQEGDVEKLRFEFATPVNAAVFSRFGYYWLVFDSKQELQIPDEIKMSDIFQAAEKIPVEGAQVFSLTQSKDAYATVTKDKNAWVIEFDPKAEYKLDRPLKLEDSTDAYKIPATNKGRRIDITDSHVGDKLIVVPFSEPGFGVTTEQQKPNFVLEKSNLGVVMKQILPPIAVNLDDALVIKIPKDGKSDDTQTAETEQGGEKKADEKVDPKNLKPLFKFEKWPQLTAAEFDVAGRKLRGDNFEYAKFLYTQGLYAEAANILKGVKGFQAQFLSASSYYMIGRYADALNGFDRLVLNKNMDADELRLWKVASNMRLKEIQPQLAQSIEMSGFSMPLNLNNYPDEMRSRLLIDLVGDAVDRAASTEAQNYLNLLPKSGVRPDEEEYKNFLQAKIYYLQGKKDRAYQMWSSMSASTDRESRAKAQYEMIMGDLEHGKIKPDQAIKKLNDLRVVWRGDIFEYNLLYSIAGLYTETKNEVETLRIYREMLSNFPRFPKNEEIASKMQDLFNTAMERSFSKKENIFEAVTIYYEFEELKPVGEKGDQVTMQLAEALTKFDLLTDAAKLLQRFADSKKDIAEQAEIETRVAVLYFLNNKYKEASDVLRKKYSAEEIPQYLQQERDILLARCLIELGDYGSANATIAKLPAEMFFRFKTDILWKQRKWAELIESYKYVTEKDGEDIIKLSVAYALTGSDQELTALRTSYSDKMKKTEYADDFDFITDTDNVDYRNLASTLRLPDTEKLIAKYKEKIATGGISAVAANPADAKTSAGTEKPEAKAVKDAEQKPQPEAKQEPKTE